MKLGNASNQKLVSLEAHRFHPGRVRPQLELTQLSGCDRSCTWMRRSMRLQSLLILKKKLAKFEKKFAGLPTFQCPLRRWLAQFISIVAIVSNRHPIAIQIASFRNFRDFDSAGRCSDRSTPFHHGSRLNQKKMIQIDLTFGLVRMNSDNGFKTGSVSDKLFLMR